MSWPLDELMTGFGPEPSPEPRSPGMSELPPAVHIDPNDLMTAEELDAQGIGEDTKPDLTLLPFKANLAEHIDETDLDALGQDLIDMVNADIESQGDWEQRVRRGLDMIGLRDFKWGDGAVGSNPAAMFPGASTVVHPMLAEAGIQSMSRAIEELLPAEGPCKTLVMGQESPDKRDAADRVADHMNYQLTVEDEVYFWETNQLHLYITWFGTAYRKASHDPILDKNVLRLVKGDDLILPYDSSSYRTAPRATHRFALTENDLKKYQRAGVYLDIELAEPPDPEPVGGEEALAKVDGKTVVRSDEDTIFTIYEIEVALDLKNFEDGEHGIAVPYIVSVEKDSGKVLSIYRNWKPNDVLKGRRTRFSEYWYLPGLGAKGYGLLHVMGSLADAGTDALRALLDSATWNNMQGGFKAKDAAMKAGTTMRTPGVWADVDLTSEELQKAFYTPPSHPPSATLYQLLGLIYELCQRFSSTTDLMVGEGDNKGPVGTTIALIEQGQKIYSGVHKRGHASLGTELKMLFELNAEHIPEEGYPYAVPGDDLVVYRKDYDTSMVSIVPVSDPNIFSQTQRIAQAQAVYQLMQDNPADFRRYRVLRAVLKAMKIPDIEDILIDLEDIPVTDPVSENVAMLTGRPVKAHEGENHLAHLATHIAFSMHPQFGGLPQAAAVMGPAMMAHLAEHLALYYAQTMRGMGVAVPPLNLNGGPGEPISDEAQPGQADAIAQRAAAMIGQFMATTGISVPQGTGAGDKKLEAETRKTDADAFLSFAGAIAALVKAGQDIQQSEQELAGLDAFLSGGAQPGSTPAPNGAPGSGPAAPGASGGAAPGAAAPVTASVHPPQQGGALP